MPTTACSPASSPDREGGVHPEPDADLLDREQGVRQGGVQQPQRGSGVEGDERGDLVALGRPRVQARGHRPVGAHHPALGDAEVVRDRDGRVQRAPGRQDDVRPRLADRRHRGAGGVADPLVVGHEGAVDVQGDEQRAVPDEPGAVQPVVLGVGARGRTSGGRRPVGPTRARIRARPRADAVGLIGPPARAPRGRRGSRAGPPGTRTEPSGCWWFSRIATIHRVVPSVPLRVATARVVARPASARGCRAAGPGTWCSSTST